MSVFPHPCSYIYAMRKVPSFLLSLAAALCLAPASNALAQDSGVDQYLENPGRPGGGRVGGGGGGVRRRRRRVRRGRRRVRRSDPPQQLRLDPRADRRTPVASPRRDRRWFLPADCRWRQRGVPTRQGIEACCRERREPDEATDSAVGESGSSSDSDSGSSGIGILLPILLGALLVAAIAVASCATGGARRPAPREREELGSHGQLVAGAGTGVGLGGRAPGPCRGRRRARDRH